MAKSSHSKKDNENVRLLYLNLTIVVWLLHKVECEMGSICCFSYSPSGSVVWGIGLLCDEWPGWTVYMVDGVLGHLALFIII